MDADKAKQLHDLEQATTALTQNMPPMWWGLYNNCVKEGFSKEQAFAVLLTYINSTCRPYTQQ